MRRARRLAVAVLVAVGGSVLVPPVDAGAVPAQVDAEGEIVDFALQPAVLAVTSGSTVSWTNAGARPHTVTDRGGMFDTGPVLPGASGSVTFEVPGTYEVFCRINPSSMNATVVVEPGDDPPPAVRIQAFDEARDGQSLRFDPAELQVDAGTEVVLANVGGQPHSLRADDKSFRIPVIEPGAEAGRFAGGNRSVVVEAPGRHTFFCEIHPDDMRGTIVVRAGPGGGGRGDDDGEGGGRPPPTTAPAERPPPDGTATMDDFEFAPAELTVEPGAAITWENDGAIAHTATFDDLDIDTGSVAPGERVTVDAPDDPGTYSYYCSFHPQMRGALLVRAPQVEVVPPAARAEPPDGTVAAYALAALFLLTGVGGLVLALRPRRPAPV